MEDTDGVDNSPRHSRCRNSGQSTDSRRRQNKPRKTQTEQIIHQGTVNADGADKAQRADVDGASHGRRKQSKELTET